MKGLNINKNEEITFDDVLLIPNKSSLSLEEDYKIDISTWLTKKIKLKIPLMSAGMVSVTEWEMAEVLAKEGGIGVIHSFLSKEEQVKQVKKVKEKNLIVAACVYEGWHELLNHIKNLVEAKVDVVVLESYHAYNERVFKIIKQIRKKFPKLDLIVGNVVTGEAVEALCKIGVDAIKVGIGSGSHCTTRIVTGFGRPQLSAVYECSKVAKKFKVPIISDGGIRSSGDVVKALSFGADVVMIGGLLAGCDQSPGRLIIKQGIKYKESFGSCTIEAARHGRENKREMIKKIKIFLKKVLLRKEHTEKKEDFFQEGIGGLIEYKGNAVVILRQLIRGIKRGMWYAGAENIKELQNKSRFVKITDIVIKENLPATEILKFIY